MGAPRESIGLRSHRQQFQPRREHALSRMENHAKGDVAVPSCRAEPLLNIVLEAHQPIDGSIQGCSSSLQALQMGREVPRSSMYDRQGCPGLVAVSWLGDIHRVRGSGTELPGLVHGCGDGCESKWRRSDSRMANEAASMKFWESATHFPALSKAVP